MIFIVHFRRSVSLIGIATRPEFVGEVKAREILEAFKDFPIRQEEVSLWMDLYKETPTEKIEERILASDKLDWAANPELYCHFANRFLAESS